MIRIACLAALLTLAGASGAFAQTGCASDSLKAAGDCFNKALVAADADMQGKYQEDQATVKDQSAFAALLTKSQDAFLAYRTATCDALVQTYWQEGQLQSVAVSSCKLALTKARTADLENMFHGLWGLQ
jgi:uncharacterized protein YecT (DUF1311 family)